MNDDGSIMHGTVIDSRYRIKRKIADGGMATVYLADDERLGRTVAIKVMHIQLAQGPHRAQFVERFRREAKSAASIANPHIVQVYDSGEVNGRDYLVMEYVRGVNLRQSMNANGTFSVRETLRIVAETLDGLSAAHRAGVVHRDIKPENILLNSRGRVQITDFGLAKAVSQATLSTTGMLLGTAAYLAPEMIEQNLATAQGDCYSVGIMAWEMLAGQVPFQSDNPVTLVFKHVNENVPSIATICRGIDPQVAAFIAFLTAREVGKRPEDAAAALIRLKELVAQLDPKALDYRYDPNAPTIDALGDVSAMGLTAHFATSDATSAQVGEMWAGSARQMQEEKDRQEQAGHAAATGTAGSGAGSPRGSGAPNASTTDGTAGGAAGLDGAAPADGAKEGEATQDPNATAVIDDPERTRTMAQHDAGEPRTRLLKRKGAGAATPPQTPEGPQDDAPADGDGAKDGHGGKRSRRWPLAVLIAVLVVALAGGGGFAAWYYIGPGSYWSLPVPEGSDCAEGEECPIAGVEWSSYAKELDAQGIPYAVTEEYSDSVASGRIISTSPATAGAHLSKRTNQTLAVAVSKGVKQATVPSDILDASSDAGKDPIRALQDAGFTNIVHNASDDQYSLTVPDGAAIAVSPDPGTTLDHNAAVTVTLSKGPMPVSMPDIAGKAKSEAATLLEAAKLNATYSEQYSDTVEAGTVISSSVAAGTTLHWGDDVDVVVSKGPQMVTLPDVVGMSTSEATSTLEALGLKVKVSAPLGDLTHTVRIMSPSAGDSVRLRDADGNATVVTLTVV